METQPKHGELRKGFLELKMFTLKRLIALDRQRERSRTQGLSVY